MSDIELPESIKIPTLPAEVATGASRAKAYMTSLVVIDQDSYEMVDQEVKSCISRWKHIEAVRVSFTDPLNKTVKRINDWFRTPLADLQEARDTGETKMLSYRKDEQEKADEARRVREEAIRKTQLEAERKAREEQAKLEAEARVKREAEDRQRQAAERAEQEAREARERELAAKRRGDAQAQEKARLEAAEAERQRQEAAAAERKAREQAEKAEQSARDRPAAILEQASADIAAQPMPMISAPSASGTAARKKWRCEVYDKLALVRAVAEGKVPLSVLDVPEGPLNRAANALQGQLNYPGVRCIPEESLAFRTKG